MLKLDHLTIIAPSLEQGLAHVRQQIGIDMPAGGKHPEMGTHNHLLRLGDDLFLEVIALDPDAVLPQRQRWFGLDRIDKVTAAWARGECLTGWVARTRELNEVLSRHGSILGQATRVSRGDRSWLITVPEDGSLPAQGAAPSVIDWGPRGPPAPAMPDLRCQLAEFALEHPDPEFVRRLYADLGVEDGPKIYRGARQRYRAVISAPTGRHELQ